MHAHTCITYVHMYVCTFVCLPCVLAKGCQPAALNCSQSRNSVDLMQQRAVHGGWGEGGRRGGVWQLSVVNGIKKLYGSA